MPIAENIARVRERIVFAAKRAGRNPDDITLVSVSKGCSAEQIRESYQAGIRVFGESRVQEFTAKAVDLRDLKGAQWRMIGHLQSNKAAKAAGLFSTIDSVDSIRLAELLNSSAQRLGKKLPVLIEINLGGEAAKSGLAPQSSELRNLLDAVSGFTQLEVRGLMTVPPATDDPEQARPYFRRLREMRDEISAMKLPAVAMEVLSMGMSQDFEAAIEEGSTCVRIGTAIFGERNPWKP